MRCCQNYGAKINCQGAAAHLPSPFSLPAMSLPSAIATVLSGLELKPNWRVENCTHEIPTYFFIALLMSKHFIREWQSFQLLARFFFVEAPRSS
jgi:hypothetical protein